MNRIFSRLALAGVCAIAASTAAVADPEGNNYLVTVTTSFGTQFQDCFSFDMAGNLTVAGLGTLAYRNSLAGSKGIVFEAVSPLGLAEGIGFAITFNGVALGNAVQGRINATGADEQGDFYKILGYSSASCGPTAANAAMYRPH